MAIGPGLSAEEMKAVYEEALAQSRADGYLAGQKAALEWYLKPGSFSSASQVRKVLARLERGEALDDPACPRCGEPGFNAAVGCDKCGSKNPNPEESDG